MKKSLYDCVATQATLNNLFTTHPCVLLLVITCTVRHEHVIYWEHTPKMCFVFRWLVHIAQESFCSGEMVTLFLCTLGSTSTSFITHHTTMWKISFRKDLLYYKVNWHRKYCIQSRKLQSATNDYLLSHWIFPNLVPTLFLIRGLTLNRKGKKSTKHYIYIIP